MNTLKSMAGGVLSPSGQWKAFNIEPKAQSEIFKNIVTAVIENSDSKLTADHCTLELEQNPSMTPTSADSQGQIRRERRNSIMGGHRPHVNTSGRMDQMNWTTQDVRKCLWSMQHIMRDDPCRRATYGITIENATTREPKALVELFAAFAFADRASLGFDPTMMRAPGDPSQFIITKDRRFRTRKILSSFGAEPLRGRGTRVYEAIGVDEHGKEMGDPVVLKDIWIDHDRMREGTILARLYDEEDKKLSLSPCAPALGTTVLTWALTFVIATERSTTNAQLASLILSPGVKRVIQMTVERAVCEIILPVVECLATIAGISTRELVAKDFALEQDEEKMRKAAHLMMHTLLEIWRPRFPCKEPLRSNMVTHARHLLTEQGYTEWQTIDIACSVIENAAKEHAVADVDDVFILAHNDHRMHREQQRTGQPYWDSAVALPTFAAGLPEPLRPHPSALSHEQFRVYGDFDVDSCRFVGTSVHGPAPFPRNEQHALPYINGSTMPEIHPAHGLLGHNQSLERFAQIIIELERLLDQMPPTQAASSLPANHDISLLIRQILVTASQAADREDTMLAFSPKVVQLLYKAPTQLGREVYAALLDRLCETSAQVSKEVIEWLVHAEDERKFNDPVTALLLKSNLVPIMEQDAQLAKLIMRDLKPSAINFTADLIRDCLLGPAPYASRQHFRHSLDALGVREGLSDESPDTAMYDRLARHYTDWVRVFQRSPFPEKSFVAWVTQLTAQGIPKGEEISSFFYRLLPRFTISPKFCIAVVVLAHFHEEAGKKPFRLFSSLFNDLHAIEATLHGAYFQLLIALWSGWSAFHRLLISLLKFLAPFIRTADLQNASRSLFCGVRRLLLVLLHDFPEFLAEYYFTICDVLPPCCIQLRNVVLSAYRPKLMLPDPHLVDMRAEMGPVRPVLSDYAIALGDGDLRAGLDLFLMDLMADRYSLPLINALTLYVGASSVVQAKARTGMSIFIFPDLGRALFLRLATDLDIDGQHHLMSAIVTHLRYPSAHTQWFGLLALFLFAEVKSENFAEVTTKVLLERFIVHCPHPWGALVTFIELLCNPK
ncbi:hypothetical protein BS47DRAFT_1362032 [Hydnum rufescens UP504]|uniref:Uncharacterized protein n=1 Tax=Hydnum rufescens UP504 TaxID=1448309 RepID=A0A9P6AXY8_9AGAM|nr:hypothetical protein BS47DRAFT_1362032 [Hydnum rufescens UP504]